MLDEYVSMAEVAFPDTERTELVVGSDGLGRAVFLRCLIPIGRFVCHVSNGAKAARHETKFRSAGYAHSFVLVCFLSSSDEGYVNSLRLIVRTAGWP